MKLYKYILFFVSLFIILSCKSYNQDDYRELVVVESYLVAGRTLPFVQISTTSPLSEQYSFSNNALNDANVRISLLDENGEAEETFFFSHSSLVDGIYQATSGHTVQPKRTYRLDIDFDNRDEIISAETTVPDQFEVISDIQDRIVYQSEDQLEITLSPTESTQRQNVFVFNTIAENPVFENLTPFYRNSVQDGKSRIEDFVSNSSGLINEGNFQLDADGAIRLRFPWLGVAFFEENIIATNSLDKNMFDLIRSQDVQLGGSTLPPGEIPNLIYNIEGGIGVFGSLASDTVRTFIERPLE